MKKNRKQMIIDALIFVVVIYIPLFMLIFVSDGQGHAFEFSPDEEWFSYKTESYSNGEQDEYLNNSDEKWIGNSSWVYDNNNWDK